MFWKDLCFQKLYSIGLELYIYLNTDLIFQMDKTNDIFSFIFVKSSKIVCWHPRSEGWYPMLGKSLICH